MDTLTSPTHSKKEAFTLTCCGLEEECTLMCRLVAGKSQLFGKYARAAPPVLASKLTLYERGFAEKCCMTVLQEKIGMWRRKNFPTAEITGPRVSAIMRTPITEPCMPSGFKRPAVRPIKTEAKS